MMVPVSLVRKMIRVLTAVEVAVVLAAPSI